LDILQRYPGLSTLPGTSPYVYNSPQKYGHGQGLERPWSVGIEAWIWTPGLGTGLGIVGCLACHAFIDGAGVPSVATHSLESSYPYKQTTCTRYYIVS
jgi:hypothetical protein